jgi:hypothetical protein
MGFGTNSQGFRSTDGKTLLYDFESWICFEKKLGRLKPLSRITFECTVPGIAEYGALKPFYEIEAKVLRATAGGKKPSLAEQHKQAMVQERIGGRRVQQKKYREKAKAKKAREKQNLETERLVREAKEKDKRKRVEAVARAGVDELMEEQGGDNGDEGVTFSGDLEIVEPKQYLKEKEMVQTEMGESSEKEKEDHRDDDLEAMMLEAFENDDDGEGGFVEMDALPPQ